MFLVNSCLGLFSAASFEAPLFPKLRGQLAEFLNNPSPVGLRILFLPTCVGLRYGHIRYSQSFSRLCPRRLHYLFRSLTTGVTNTRQRRFQSVPLLKSFCGYGISTVCASVTRFRLTLAPGLLGADEPSSKNLRLSAIMILT